jgi:hypothetical protein
MSKERFEHTEDGITNYIEDSKTGIIYIGSNYYDMKDMTKLLNKQNQRIIDLEEQLKNAIVPKFKRQEIVYSIEYGEISEIEELQVVAYLDNYITLCENRETSKMDWVHKDYLFATKEEALKKLEEMKNGKV